MLYRKMSVGQLGSVQRLWFNGMPPMSVEDARRLGRCLALCGRLEVLTLDNTGMGDEACKAIFMSLGEGALPSVKWIHLHSSGLGDTRLSALATANELGDAGLSAVAAAVERGAMPSLWELTVNNRQHPALKAACQTRGIMLVDNA